MLAANSLVTSLCTRTARLGVPTREDTNYAGQWPSGALRTRATQPAPPRSRRFRPPQRQRSRKPSRVGSVDGRCRRSATRLRKRNRIRLGFQTIHSAPIDRAPGARSKSDEFFVWNPIFSTLDPILCLKRLKRLLHLLGSGVIQHSSIVYTAQYQ